MLEVVGSFLRRLAAAFAAVVLGAGGNYAEDEREALATGDAHNHPHKQREVAVQELSIEFAEFRALVVGQAFRRRRRWLQLADAHRKAALRDAAHGLALRAGVVAA